MERLIRFAPRATSILAILYLCSVDARKRNHPSHPAKEISWTA